MAPSDPLTKASTGFDVMKTTAAIYAFAHLFQSDLMRNESLFYIDAERRLKISGPEYAAAVPWVC